MSIEKLKQGIKNPSLILKSLLMRTSKFWPDEFYLKALYRLFYGERLNLENPIKYSEKMQWLKLYYHKEEFTNMVDKYEVKNFVSETIGAEYVIPYYGVYNSFDEIDFNHLPNQFILKCTHDSGSFVICENKETFDKESARAKLEKGLRCNFFYTFREWPYKNVRPRIIAEKYMPSLGKSDSTEYKLTCCDGMVKTITVCGGIPHTDFSLRSNDNFSKDWTRQDWYAYYKPKGGIIEKPAQIDEIVNLSEKLSIGIPYVRVDWYVIDGKPYFISENSHFIHGLAS